MEDHFYDFNEPEVQNALTSFFAEMNETKENSAKNLQGLFHRLKKKNMVFPPRPLSPSPSSHLRFTYLGGRNPSKQSIESCRCEIRGGVFENHGNKGVAGAGWEGFSAPDDSFGVGDLQFNSSKGMYFVE